MSTKQPEALILAALNDAETWPDGLSIVTFAARSAAELRRLHAENESLRTGYDAARLEIESLQAQAQQCGAGAGCCAQAARIEELEAQLEAVGAVGAVPDGWWLVPVQPTNKQVVMLAGALLPQKQNTADSRHPDWSNAVGQAEHAYRAMLEAAPEPQPAAQGQEEAVAQAVAAEREACAQLAAQTVCDMHIPTGVKIYGARAAKAIRARGTDAARAPQPAAQVQKDAGGWMRDGGMLYRLTDERRPTNFDEIRVTMANGSRDTGQLSAQAERLLVMLAAPQPSAQAQPVATIYVTEDGSREVDDWKVELPVGATTLYTAAQAQEDAKDAARYRFLRNGEWRDTELEPFIRLQRNSLWDSKIDAAIAAGAQNCIAAIAERD